jgi:PAS domain S-box-containing protein
MINKDQSSGCEKELAVLLIEDDLVDQMAFIRLMKEHSKSYKFEIAGSIADALTILEKTPIDIIISDFYLGDGTPLDILPDIIKRGIPIIIVTSVVDPDAATDAIKRGVDDLLVKDQNYNYLKVLPLTIERTLSAHKVRVPDQKRQTQPASELRSQKSDIPDDVGDIHVRRLVIDQSELIARYRTDGATIFVNDVFCQYFGKTRGELIGKQFDLLMPAEECGLLEGHRAALTRENSKVTIEHRITLPDGSIHWIRRKERALFDEDGGIIEYQTVAMDITDRKLAEDALRESEERYRMLAEHAFDGIAIQDFSGTILYVNQSIVQMLGYSRSDEILGKNTLSFIAPEYRELVIQDMQNVINGIQGYLQKYQAINSRGEKIFIESVGTKITYRGKPANIIALRDINERENAVINLHKELARKKDFIDVAAHELRTPLQPVIGFLDLLIEQADQYRILPDVLKILKKVRTYVEMEREIVNKILSISLLESVHHQFRPPLEPVTIRELIELVIQQEKCRDEAAVVLNIPKDTVITSNGAIIFEIIDTLVSNAVTYSRPPRQITITSEETGTEFRLSVSDNGVGIPVERFEVIFEPFFISDADKLSRKYGRLGLGLTMARKQASMLGGTLTLTSSSGAGSTFTLSLPLQEPVKQGA